MPLRITLAYYLDACISVFTDIEVGFNTASSVVTMPEGQTVTLCVELQRGTLERNVSVAYNTSNGEGINTTQMYIMLQWLFTIQSMVDSRLGFLTKYVFLDFF